MKYLVTPEINNKLFLRKANNISQIVYNSNILLSSVKSFKLIKSLIELELFLGQRPIIMASYLKKSLIINLKVTKNSSDIQYLPLLQKTPVLWNKYFNKINLFKYYNLPPYQSGKRAITAHFTNLSKYKNWSKSVYLD